MVQEIKKARVAGIASILFAGGVALPAWGAPLQNWRFDPTTNQLEVTIASKIKPRYFFLAQPARIVLDLPNTEVGEFDTQASYNGAVRQIRVSQAESGVTRIVMELSSDAVLAPKQVQLVKAGSIGQSDRWIFRPIFASAPSGVRFSSLRPTSPSVESPQPISATNTAPSNLGLPPAPPDALPDLPSVTPQATTPPIAGTRAQPEAAIAPRRRNSLLLSEVNPSLAIPDSFPPIAAPTTIQTPSVSVPPLSPRSSPPSEGSIDPLIPSDLRGTPINIPTPDPSQISVPPLNSEEAAPQTPRQPDVRRPARSRTPTIEFGQPLPDSDPAFTPQSQRSTTLASNRDAILTAGSRLKLRYAGTAPLKLQTNNSRQEVLILQTAIRDRAGRLIAPPGSAVFGRFETNRNGSQFVANSIDINGQSVALIGQTEAIGGARQVQDNRLLLNSGIGALAGALLGGIAGNGLSGGSLLGGAAVGAGVTYVTAPKPATIQPGQTFELRLSEDFR